MSIGISSSSVRWMAPPRAPVDVSISSRGGPEPFHQRNTTFCRQRAIPLGDGLDLTDRLFQPCASGQILTLGTLT